jgi:hypothetical protein
MEIHLVSSLTPEDESRLAPAMLAAIGRFLDTLPISYSLRIETAAGGEIQQHHIPDSELDAAPLLERPLGNEQLAAGRC